MPFDGGEEKRREDIDSGRNPALEIKGLFCLVGAGRFERPTPCAQVRGFGLSRRFSAYAKAAAYLLFSHLQR